MRPKQDVFIFKLLLRKTALRTKTKQTNDVLTQWQLDLNTAFKCPCKVNNLPLDKMSNNHNKITIKNKVAEHPLPKVAQ